MTWLSHFDLDLFNLQLSLFIRIWKRCNATWHEHSYMLLLYALTNYTYLSDPRDLLFNNYSKKAQLNSSEISCPKREGLGFDLMLRLGHNHPWSDVSNKAFKIWYREINIGLQVGIIYNVLFDTVHKLITSTREWRLYPSRNSLQKYII